MEVARFLKNNLCCRFGVPLEIVTDQGPGFRKNIVKELEVFWDVKHRYNTPYYPRCSGLVESFNGTC